MSPDDAPGEARADDWRLTVPVRTPYDRELLAQSIRSTVARRGRVRVVVGRSLLLVDALPLALPLCPRCGRAPGRVQCRLDGTATCLTCGLAAIAAATEADVGRLAVAASTRGPHSERHGNRADAARPSRARRRQ